MNSRIVSIVVCGILGLVFAVRVTQAQSLSVTNGLRLWLKADAGVQTDGANNVTNWLDQSGNGYDVSQANAANQPLLGNFMPRHKPAVRFAAAHSYDRLARNIVGSNLFSATEATIYIVLRQNAAGPNCAYYWSTGAEQVGLFFTYSGTFIFDYGVSSAVDRLNVPNTPAGWASDFHVVAASRDTSKYVQLRVDGTNIGSTNFVNDLDVSLSADIDIGALGATGNRLKGDIAEVLIYNRALSSNDNLSVENYLNDKYNLNGHWAYTNGVRLWLKADAGVQTDGANNVTNWLDQSGNGYDVSQINAGNQPLLGNFAARHKPAVRFGAAHSWDGLTRNIAGSNLFSAAEATFYVVQRQNVVGANATLFWMTTGANRVGLSLAYQGSPENLIFDYGNLSGNADRLGVAAPAGWDNAFHVVSASRDAFKLAQLRVDGTNVGSATFVNDLDVSSSGELDIGVIGVSPGNRLNGDIAEIMIYDWALSIDDNALVESYLNDKWINIPKGAVLRFR